MDNALPEEFSAELVNGRIIVAPAPDGDHNENLASVADQVQAHLPELRLYAERGLAASSYRADVRVKSSRLNLV